jgi:SAM-dependent methyltransferase
MESRASLPTALPLQRTDSLNVADTNSWSRQYALRRDIESRYGDIFHVPLAKKVRDVLVDNVADGAEVLEIGAGDRRMKQILEARRSGIRYESMDVDPQGEHEYRDLADIHKKYDVVFAVEVAEHLSLDELRTWLPQLAALLKPGGRLILSTPNVYYPPNFLRDVTHRTPLCYDELGAMLELAGLNVTQIVRIYNDPLHRIFLRRYLFGWLFRLIGIDFARQIMVVARRASPLTVQ